MNAQDSLAALNIGTSDHNAAVEAARTQKCRIEHVGTVRRGNEDHALVRLKPVHLDQQLVQRLLALIVTTAETGTAVPSDSVDFVDEDDAGSVFLALLEQVADATRADADEHLNEVRAGDREERNVRFTCNRAGQQGFARSRRSDQQDAFRDTPTEFLEFLGLAKELDDFLQLFLGFLDARNVLERDFLLL